jgi:uncharacterized protein
MNGTQKIEIIPREKLDFDLDGDIPKFWMGNDPLKTRFFDAMSLSFPEGERYFIQCVRAFKDKIDDPHLQKEVTAFIRQEAQHGIAHTQYNNRLKAQGVNVDGLEKYFRDIQARTRRDLSDDFNLAITAGFEHLTAIMCHGFIERRDILKNFEPRMRALYAWHAIEEVEHKSVAFDVMARYSKIGYFRRIGAMLLISVIFPLQTFALMNYILRMDGFGFWKQATMWPKFLWWMYKPVGGMWTHVMGHYLKWYLPGFHPWKSGEVKLHTQWIAAFEQVGHDPVKATNVVVNNILKA